jgi:hypothetical protein
MHPLLFSLSKEDHSVAVEARQPDDRAQTLAAHEIEDDDFVLSHVETLRPGAGPAIMTRDPSQPASMQA